MDQDERCHNRGRDLLILAQPSGAGAGAGEHRARSERRRERPGWMAGDKPPPYRRRTHGIGQRTANRRHYAPVRMSERGKTVVKDDSTREQISAIAATAGVFVSTTDAGGIGRPKTVGRITTTAIGRSFKEARAIRRTTPLTRPEELAIARRPPVVTAPYPMPIKTAT
jgi:hypothetical protein